MQGPGKGLFVGLGAPLTTAQNQSPLRLRPRRQCSASEATAEAGHPRTHLRDVYLQRRNHGGMQVVSL